MGIYNETRRKNDIGCGMAETFAFDPIMFMPSILVFLLIFFFFFVFFYLQATCG